jgi:hypothetical protein
MSTKKVRLSDKRPKIWVRESQRLQKTPDKPLKKESLTPPSKLLEMLRKD